jgi:asparagine synthase (glutamine-hydrolysing)
METHVDLQKDPEGWPSVMASLMALQAEDALPHGVVAPLEKLCMFNSLVPRLPFTDHKLAEFLLGLPDHLRTGKTGGKVLLRKYMAKAHPEILLPDVGPAQTKLPLAEYLAANPLKEMVDICLSETSVRRRDLLEWDAVKRILAGLKTGEAIYARQVFALLTLELWFRIFVDHEKGWISK